MFKSYLKIAWRNIARNKVYAAINILGLSLGICTCIVIYLICSYELSFDTFHPDKERIYRVMGDVTESTGEKLHFARIPLAVSQTARRDVSGLGTVAGIIPYNTKINIPASDSASKKFDSRIDGANYITTAITEPQYFEIFHYGWLAGNPATALNTPFTVVLAESKARRYFGNGPLDKIIGKQVIYEDSLTVRVSGIVKDQDKNTDLAFTDFISYSTLENSFLKNSINQYSWKQGDLSTWTFVKLSKGRSPVDVNTQLATLVKLHADQQVKLTLWLEPLSDIHFNADVIENPIRTAHMPTLYGLMAIALFILVLAIINFINLSTAQSIRRAKEAGIRKVLGSSRGSLVLQFLSEAFVLTFCAGLLGIMLINPVLTAFSSFIPAGVSFHFFDFSTFIILAVAVIVTSLFAGLYPAKVLSSYPAALCLKGAGLHKGNEKWWLRKGLIVFQFTVSLIFIIGSLVIAKQLEYTRKKDLGFSADAIITTQTPGGESHGKIHVLAQNIRQIPGVSKVALQWLSPMTENARGMKIKFKRTDEKDLGVTQVAGDENFIPLYQIKLLAGRNLVKTDTVNEFVINENLSALMGNKTPADAPGKILYWNDKPYPIVGVTADFHTSSLHDPITPLCIINRPDREGSIAIKLASAGKQPGSIKTIISQIEKVWKQIYPAGVFNYRFYDDSLAMLYEKDKQTATLMNTSMLVTVFISCIGLFGLSLFTTEKKAKEISIRKILGASVTNIVIMISTEFVVLVILSIFAASPVAWYFMNRWLQGFAYRIPISSWLFMLAGLTAILIALLTVGFQSIKAAIANPVKNLRTE